MICKRELLKFYQNQLTSDFIPYWKQQEDTELGGILNGINNYGDKRLSDSKFTWSQGRYLWILGKIKELISLNKLPDLVYENLDRQMDQTFEFIANYSIYDQSRCCYLLDRRGTKLPDSKTGRLDASIFADCFALIGMAQYIKVTGQADQLEIVIHLYDSIIDRIGIGDFLTEPYPIPKGYQVHSIPMILVNTTFEYIKMRQRLGLPYEKEKKYGLRLGDYILNELEDGGLIREHVSKIENSDKRLLDRHRNPGHTLEDMWFIAEYLQEFGDLNKYLDKIVKIACQSFDIGWDKEYGGLLRFVDLEGGRPQGETAGSEYEKLIQDTWDMKLWWPHSETLYLFLYLYELTGNSQLLLRYQKVFDYTFRTFPNKELGEWIQIRRRDGTPEDKLVALPVKDPFHIMRNFIKIVQLYSDLI